MEKSKRLWPHKLKGEGHFVAVFRKKGNLSLDRCETGKAKKKNSTKDVLSKEERKIFDEFIIANLDSIVNNSFIVFIRIKN